MNLGRKVRFFFGKMGKKNKKKLSKGRLGVLLGGFETFLGPKVRLEQYPTEPEIAADMLWKAYQLGDIEGKVIGDFGCGTGILGLGAKALGADKVSLVDIDEDALIIAKKNISRGKSEGLFEEGRGEISIFHTNIEDFEGKVDTVLQNPPFGTKVRGADRAFIERASVLGKVVYSLHKTETAAFVRNLGEKVRLHATHIWDYDFALKPTYSFHKSKMRRIKVSCIRFVRKNGEI